VYEYSATLERVVDGDTYDLDIDLGLRVHTCTRVRLRGVDTPETYGVSHDSQEWREGQAAKRFVDEWLGRRATLRVKTFRDRTGKYGRWLVEIEDPDTGEALSESLLAAGHARRVNW
jgi:micrococcal nuclease